MAVVAVRCPVPTTMERLPVHRGQALKHLHERRTVLRMFSACSRGVMATCKFAHQVLEARGPSSHQEIKQKSQLALNIDHDAHVVVLGVLHLHDVGLGRCAGLGRCVLDLPDCVAVCMARSEERLLHLQDALNVCLGRGKHSPNL